MEPNNKKQSLTTSASIHSLTNLSNSSANEKEKREESLTLKKENEEESLQSSSSTVETSGQIKERLRNTNNENSSIISQKNLINEESNNNNNKTKEKGTEFNKINLKKAATEKFVVGGEAFGTVIIEKAKIHPFKLLNFCLKIMIPKHKLDSSSADDKDIKKKKEEHRIVKANDREFNAKFKYADNFIKTSKYSLFTFVPVNLFQQFTRIANFYFLVLLCLQCIPQISSVNWVYTLVPLSFVLLCSAIKDGYDDLLRHRSDRIVNQRVAYVLRYNTKRGKIDICEEEWMNVKVGDIVRMESGDFIAADLLLLSTSDSGICYIETAELDGETNLKTKMALPCTAEMGDIIDKINAFDGLIVCEPPNNRLDQFNGRLEWEGKKYNLDNNNMLLRGCCLRNTRFCYGVVVFAGADTKLMQNSGEAPLKRTSLDKFLNLLILGIVLFLFVCTLICTLMTGFWEHIIGRHFRVFLPWDNIVPRIKNLTTISIPVVQGVSSILQTTDSRESSIAPSQVFFIVALQFFSYIILLNTVVPISLYISVEMIRLAHSKFINCDLKMYDPKTDTAANARTSTLNEELGQVQYIFSDKTGTLTQNVMIFKKCSINGRCYGDFRNERGDVIENIDENTQQGIDFSFNRWHEKNFKFYDKTLLIDTVEGLKEVQEFWRLLAICHTVMPEGKGDVLEYQAQSPDEAALTSAARNFGFVFRKRTPQSITLEVNGRTETYEVLHILDFDNVRKRMSLLVRTLNNQIRLYCKGADTMIMERLDEKNTSQLLREATLQHLDKFATDGLRTLCVAYKIVDGEYCEKWLAQLHEALLDLENKEKRVDVLYEEMEKDMLLLGATAIEDKLQDGVPQTIKALAAANIKLWVLTGDKTETAINIAFSCGLLTEYMREVSIIDGKDEKEVEVQLKDTIRRMQNAKVPQTVVGISSFYLPPRTPIRELSPSPTELPQNLNERQTKSASSQRPHSPIINSPTTVGQQSHRTSDVSTIFPVTLGHEEGLIINGKNNHIKLPLSEKRSEPYINKSFINQTIDDNDKNDDLIKEGSGGYALVINGEALVYALKKQHEKIFLEIARNCTSVICCRVTPLQKAKVVELVKRNIKAVTLSIGDGANDVSMIRTAHIGVGISGHEGMQAVLASDFSIGQFRYLERLLLVHGRWSYLRMCKFLRYFFYKNFAYTLTNFWYSFFSGYSAQTVYDPVLISLYNLLFTALPVLAMGILDQDVNEDYSLRFPRLYIPGQFNLFFNMRIFIYSIIHGMISSLVLFFVPYGTLYNSITSTGRDMNDYSILAFTSFTALVLVVNGQIAFDTSYWTWINWFVVFGSVGVYFAVVVGIYQVLPTRWLYGYVSIFNVDVFLRAITFPGFWLSLALICAILLLPVLGNRFFWFDAHPSYADRLRVRSRLYGEEKAKKQFPPQTSHNIPPRGRTSRWSSKQRDLRSGYAFSHCAGFGELIAKGTLFKNLEHLRIPAFQNKQQIHPTDTISTNNNNTSRTNENNTTNTRRSTFFNGGNVAGHHLLDSLRSLKKHKKSDNGNNDTNNISSLPISEENINNNSISITKFSPNIPSNISTTTTLLAEKENNNNNFENNINSNSSSSFSSSIPLTITKAEENIIGPMITHIPVNSSNINLNKNQQIDNNQQILKINNNNSSVIIPLRVPSPDRVNTTHSLVINADMEDEKPLPSNWCYNPDGTLYIPENQITENEQFPPSKQSTEIPIQINNTGKNNNNKFVSKKCKKTTNFVDSDGNSKSSSEANRKSIPIEIEKQRQQQQRLFTGKYRNTQQQHKENDDKTWKNERWKL